MKDDYELKTELKFGHLLAQDQDLATAIEALQFKLMTNDDYRTLIKLQDEREHLFDAFKAKRLKEFRSRNLKTIDGTYGKITMTERRTYKVVDPTKVPAKFFTKTVNLDLVKREDLLHRTVPGIEFKVTYGMRLTPKRNGESS